MANLKLDLETYMVAPVLRNRLFRVDPRTLSFNFQPGDERDFDSIVEALCIMGILSPVVIDNDSVIVAGEGLVFAALQIGLDDIPALRFEDLTEEECRVYLHMTRHFFKIADLDPKIVLSDTLRIMAFAETGRRAVDPQAASASIAAE